MKKTTPKTVEYIPRGPKPKIPSQAKKAGEASSIGSLLGKLSGSELTELVGKVAEVSNSGFELFTEKERTQQVEAKVKLGLKQVEANRESAILGFKARVAALDNEDKQDERYHEREMLKLYNLGGAQCDENNQIMRLIDQLEDKNISADHLVFLIDKIKGE